MKSRKFGRFILASAVSVGMVYSITACGVSHTVDFVFVTASKGTTNGVGQISSFAVDSQSGALSQVPDSPFLSGGRNPVAEVTGADSKNLYVANELDNTIVQFQIGNDGKLYSTHTVNTPGSEPVALAVSPDGKYLFVLDNFRPNNPVYTDLNPGPGGLVVIPLDSTGNFGTPVANGNTSFWPLPFQPAAINVLANGSSLYVVSRTGSVPGTNGVVTGFSIGSGGTLTPVAGSPFTAGTSPNAIASDPTSRFVYVTDGASNQIISYGVTSSGALVPSTNGPTTTGGFPDAVTVDPRGLFVYVANYNDPSVWAFAIDQATGVPTAVSSGGVYANEAGPTCVLIEPALGRFLYVSNFLADTVTGLEINPTTGGMIATQGPVYKAAAQPTCVSAVTHGNHAIQHTQG
ncbi:MAG TPA: beta-propeller fold lactonase family protein [Acidisarcina sp.]